ncbi:MAG TPA: Pvc16 family protein [Thermoanaerobaculia bacterium]|nr:Pvc16 family protein [Thermoanaerobaculia bacterium]
MSNALAIAATTATLRQVLLSGGIGRVTLLPPDAAGKNVTSDQVNLFLYQSSLDAAWRNQDVPGRAKSGEAVAPLPLNLYYLLTAYSGDPEDLRSHSLLGQAMRIFHDHPVLGAAEIASATAANLPGSDLQDQVERVRIVPQPLSTEEISKLWTAFQTPYRLSAAYLVSVVLLESQRPLLAPLPVLMRGEGDRGPTVLTSFPPLLEAVRPVTKLPGVRLGEELLLTGEHLATGTQVVFRGPRDFRPFTLLALRVVGDGEIVARLPGPDEPAGNPSKTSWPAGIYTAQVIARRPPELDLSSGELPFSLAPQIVVSPLSAPKGDVTVTVTCTPEVHPEQRVSLLFGDREVRASAHPAQTGTLSFNVAGVAAGTYVVRLRVDGVDSIPIDLSAAKPQFAADQTVVIS